MIIYCMAGLGLDKRCFQHLKLGTNEIHYLDYIEPQSWEPLTDYAQRLIEQQIPAAHQQAKLVLIGHSFGGVIMQEIAEMLPHIQQVILISSIKAHAEKPLPMRWFYWLPLFWLTVKWLNYLTFPLWAWWYGYRTKEARRLFYVMTARFSNRYYRWATRTISRWRPRPQRSFPIHSIHGSRDQMFYYKHIREPKTKIPGGNHFMLYHRPEEVSAVVNEVLDAGLESGEA